jgi:hypothetical protein
LAVLVEALACNGTAPSASIDASVDAEPTADMPGEPPAPARLVVTPSDVSLQPANSTQVTVTNSGDSASGPPNIVIRGNGAPNFTIKTNGCDKPLQPRSSCSFVVYALPVVCAPLASIDVTAAPGGLATVSVSVAWEGVRNLMPASHDFGAIAVGSSSAVFRFSGQASATGLQFVTSRPMEFVVVATDCKPVSFICPGETCSVDVVFRPQMAGPRSAVLDMYARTVSFSLWTVALSGSGIARQESGDAAAGDAGDRRADGNGVERYGPAGDSASDRADTASD